MTDEAASDWPTVSCNMPDLSDLNSKKILIHAMRRMFLGGGSRDKVASSLSSNFVRLTDHLIFEYENCRTQINLFIAESGEGHISPFARAICHMETAVTTMLRAIRIAQRIRGWQHEPRVPIPKHCAVLRDTVENQVRDVRDAIEHVYNQITNGESRDGLAACLTLKVDHFESEGKKILYSDFASWIRQLDPIAIALAEYQEPE
jgi:hypothetical protein